jgi:hypothetical protein
MGLGQGIICSPSPGRRSTHQVLPGQRRYQAYRGTSTSGPRVTGLAIRT